MTSRRKGLLLVLVVLIGVPLAGLGFGTVEVTLWLVLLAGWVYMFATWGGRSPDDGEGVSQT